MAVNLVKGQRVNLTKESGLTKVMAGLGWDINCYDNGKDFDLDLVLFMCGANGKCIDENHFIFYGNLTDPAGAVTHGGDNRTGAGDGDDETVKIDFSKIDPAVEKIVVAVTIYDAKNRQQNFGSVNNSYIRLVNEETGVEEYRYDLGEEASTNISVVFAEFYKNGTDWKFKAVGDGYDKELVDFCHEYGIDVA